jgi:hypothetical protein
MRNFSSPTEHGGSARKGKRKQARPFSAKHAMHVTMRSSRAKGAWSFRHSAHRAEIHMLLLDTAERYGIRVYRWENVFNHLHIVLSARSQRDLQAFLRVFAQRVMFAVTGARKGSPKGRFFDKIAWSRIVAWGQDFRAVLLYVWKNTLEALGFSSTEIRAMVHAAKIVPL